MVYIHAYNPWKKPGPQPVNLRTPLLGIFTNSEITKMHQNDSKCGTEVEPQVAGLSLKKTAKTIEFQTTSDISHQNAQDTHSPTKISASCCGWPIRPHKAVGSVASLHAKCRLGHSPGWAACTMARLQDPKRSGDGWGQILAHIISYPYTYPYTYPYMVEYTGCK